MEGGREREKEEEEGRGGGDLQLIITLLHDVTGK